jgi:hypothetical protein
MLNSLSSNDEKKKVVAASGYAVRSPLKKLKPHGGQLFNQTTTTG